MEHNRDVKRRCWTTCNKLKQSLTMRLLGEKLKAVTDAVLRCEWPLKCCKRDEFDSILIGQRGNWKEILFTLSIFDPLYFALCRIIYAYTDCVPIDTNLWYKGSPHWWANGSDGPSPDSAVNPKSYTWQYTSLLMRHQVDDVYPQCGPLTISRKSFFLTQKRV